MTIVVAHETLSIDHALENLQSLERQLDRRKKTLAQLRGETAGDMLRPFYNALAYSIAAERPHAETLRHLRLFRTLSVANFALATKQEPFIAWFDDTPIEFTPFAKTDFLSVDDWKRAFDACMLLRDRDGLRFLATVPESVFIGCNSGANAFDLAYFRFLAHFFRGGEDTGTWLVDVMTEANKPADNDDRQAFIDGVRYPELSMLHAFLLGDAALFNERLLIALEAHRTYYGTESEAMDTRGWISLPLLSACVIGADSKRFPIEIESGYIPRWLIVGNLGA